MQCKICEDLKTSLLCKGCIKEHHDHNHPSDPKGEGKYFNDIPMCFCIPSDITLTTEIGVPKIAIGSEYKKDDVLFKSL